MRTYEVATSTQQLAQKPTVIMVRDETTMAIANALKEEVPNLHIVSNSSELSEFIEEHLQVSRDVFIVTDVTYKFMRTIGEPDTNISWVGCKVHTLN